MTDWSICLEYDSMYNTSGTWLYNGPAYPLAFSWPKDERGEPVSFAAGNNLKQRRPRNSLPTKFPKFLPPITPISRTADMLRGWDYIGMWQGSLGSRAAGGLWGRVRRAAGGRDTSLLGPWITYVLACMRAWASGYLAISSPPPSPVHPAASN